MTSANVSSKTTKTNVGGAARARPSSPRLFFARLYGHLNDNDKVERGNAFPSNDKIVDVADNRTASAVSNVRRDIDADEEKRESSRSGNVDNAMEIRRGSELFDEAIRRKLVQNRWQRETNVFGIDKKRTSGKIGKREESDYFDRHRDDGPEDAASGICAPALVSRRLFMCRGFSAPIAVRPAAAATADVAASTSGSVLSASGLHHLTHVGHQLTTPAPFSHLHGNPQVEAHLHGLSSFLARRRKKESRPRRQRTTYSGEQTARLEFEYHRGEYISQKRRSELAQSLNLTETQIKIWFQNRRAKYKRINKAMLDQHYRNIVVSNGLVNLPICSGSSAYLGDFSFCRDNVDARCAADNFVAIMTPEKKQCGSVDGSSAVRNSTYRCDSTGSEELPNRVVSPL